MKKVLVLVLISIIVIAFYNTYIKKPVIENFHHPWRELNIWATYTFSVPSNPIKAKDIYYLYEFKKLVDKYMLKYREQKSTKEERIKIKDYLVNSDNVFRKSFYMNEKQYAAFEKKTGYGKKRAEFLIHRYIFENFIKPNANFKDSNYANKLGSDYFKKNIRSNIKLKIFNKFRSEKYKIKKYLVTSDCLDATNKRDDKTALAYYFVNLIKYGSNYKYKVVKNNEKNPNSGTFVKYITKPNIKITKPKKIHTCPTKNISITKPKPAPPKIFAVPKPPIECPEKPWVKFYHKPNFGGYEHKYEIDPKINTVKNIDARERNEYSSAKKSNCLSVDLFSYPKQKGRKLDTLSENAQELRFLINADDDIDSMTLRYKPKYDKVKKYPPGTKFDPKKEVCLDKSKVQTLLVKSSGPKGAIKHYDYYCDAKVKKKDEIKKEIEPTPYNSSTQGCDAVLDEHRRTGPGNSKNKLCYGKVYNKIKTKMNCKDPDSSCNGTVTRIKTNGRYRYPNSCHCVTKQYI